MNIKHITLASLFLVPVAYAADKEPMDGMPMDHKGMNMPMDQKSAGQTATATGTVKKVNTESGTRHHCPRPGRSVGLAVDDDGLQSKA